ncbi:uncharacterized protein LOC130677061 [Microplitis mediator]|uniref:uncharacterized protein LOC130677061 n=1 Tax=Microplitis mediator TaxID=375433 RepID=UPI0025566C50|nr:uncharacterized protein LOC130677061 [Microplitis mediator]
MPENLDNADDGKAEQVDNISEVSLSEDSVDGKRNGKESDETKNISPKNDCPLNETKHEEKKDSKPNDNSASQSGVQHLGLDDDDHLFGENSDNMILLRDGIYVKKIILDTALRTSCQGSHLDRQFLEGVMKPEYLRRCTITGNASRGKKDPKVLPIHGAAKNAIIGMLLFSANRFVMSKQFFFMLIII